ncbi:MAG: ArsR/SmtB family transcription factor [Bacillota bacterium]
MDNKYVKNSAMFKALSDPNRLIILDKISCCEHCACTILEDLHIVQSTLSHHMKVLCRSGLVDSRREGKWMYYSLNLENIQKAIEVLHEILSKNETVNATDFLIDSTNLP